jgi:hypothetical protein
MARRDLSGDRTLTSDRSKIMEVARRYGIPEWQAEMALATDPGLLQDLKRDARYNPTTTSPSAYREEPRSGGGEKYIGNIPARLVEASEKAAREHAEQVDRWTAFRDAQAREPSLTLEQWEARKEGKG